MIGQNWSDIGLMVAASLDGNPWVLLDYVMFTMVVIYDTIGSIKPSPFKS